MPSLLFCVSMAPVTFALLTLTCVRRDLFVVTEFLVALNSSTSLSCHPTGIDEVATDRISEGGNAIAYACQTVGQSVRPFVFTLCSTPTDRRL